MPCRQFIHINSIQVLKPYSYERTCINVFFRIFVKHVVTVPCSICAQTLLQRRWVANEMHTVQTRRIYYVTWKWVWKLFGKKNFPAFLFRGFFGVVLLIRFWDCVCLALAVPFCLAIIAENYFQIAFQVFCFLFCSVLRSAIVWTKMSVVIKYLFLPSRVI